MELFTFNIFFPRYDICLQSDLIILFSLCFSNESNEIWFTGQDDVR